MSEVADGPLTSVIGRPSAAASASAATASGTPATIERRLDDADVPVGHERERAATGALAAVEHDRSRLGDGQRAAGQHAVEPVERLRRQRRVVDDELDPLHHVRPAGRDGDPARAALAAQPRDRLGEVGRRDARDRRAVLGDPLAEAVDGAVVDPRTAVSPWHLGHGDALGRGRWRIRRGRPHAPRSRHHSRNVCFGGSGRSRIAVQPGSAALAIGPRPSRASFWARS